MEIFHKLAANRKIRFGIVGVGNTLLNFLVLNLVFFLLHSSKLVASIVATLCAVTVSFFLNRGFVFRHRERSLRQPIMFAVVTLTGVLLVQNLVYAFFVAMLRDHTQALSDFIVTVSGITLSHDFLDINISNFCASLIAMVWNYNGYRLFVFKPGDDKSNGKNVPDDETITLPA